MLSTEPQSIPRIEWRILLLVAAACIAVPQLAVAQGTTGALIGTVMDDQGGVLPGALVHVTSPALIGGPATTTTNEKGQLRFPTLPPGAYVLHIELPGFAPLHDEDVRIGAGATIERTVVLKLAELAESVTVEGTGSRIEVRNPGFGTRFGLQDLQAIPTRRASMFDFIRATPGISPTSAASGTVTTISAFGSGTNENQFLIDGTNFTCPCNGVARAEAGVDFIQEVQVQSVGASAEFGNFQGAVINIVLKQGSNRFLYDAAYFAQTSGLTSQPSRISVPGSATTSGYERTKYRDLTSSLGGAVVRDRVWFFGGYQYLRDEDSQPGTVPTLPRRLASEKYFGKLTWQPAARWQLVHSFHDEQQDNFDQPTIVLPFEATLHRTASVPATTFGQLTHTSSANTVWNVIVGRFVFAQQSAPSNGVLTTPSRFDTITGVTSGAPSQFSTLTIARTNAKATVSHYRSGLWGGDHELKAGGQFERAGHHSTNVIPTGTRFRDRNGQPSQAQSADPAHVGGEFATTSGFAMDNVRFGSTTVSAGLRVDHNRAISQDLSGVDLNGRETNVMVPGLGTMYTWTLWSPRLGLTTKLSADGRTMMRASYGRFSQGVLTGELEPFHPGGSTVTTMGGYTAATGTYPTLVMRQNPRDYQLDPGLRAPHTDELSVGVDRELRRDLAVAMAYVHKTGDDFIGWIDVGGQYAQTTALLPDGRSVPTRTLTNNPLDRRYQLTNPDEYSLTYNGLVSVIEKRRSHGWQALGSYTFSKAVGLQTSSAATAAGAQVSTVSPPQPSTFGQDPNDLTNALGRTPNDRPHIFRVMGAVDVPWGGVSVAANLQHFSGKPWAATALINPQDTQRRVLIEPRGSRRLSSQTLLDLRVSKTVRVGAVGNIDLLLDVFNVLNDTAEESIANDVLVSSTFGQPSTFVDPRRAMLGVRVHLGR